MTRAELKSAAKEQINGKIGILFVMALIIIGIAIVCRFIPIVGGIASFVITPAFTLSLCMVYLKLTKKEEISVGDVFTGFNKTGKALWLNIIIGFFTFLWTLLLIIPGIIKTYAYSMSFYILADNPELTAREALSKSKEMMNGHKWDLFVLQLSFFWWFLLVMVTLGIAAIYVTPYISATTANFYNSIKGTEEIEVKEEKVEEKKEVEE